MEDSKNWSNDVGPRIINLLEEINPNDRVGFLFGIVLAILLDQGLNEQQIRDELDFGIEIAFKNKYII